MLRNPDYRDIDVGGRRSEAMRNGPSEGAGFLLGPVFENRARPNGAPVLRECQHIPISDADQF